MPTAEQVARERAITALLGPIAVCNLAIPLDSRVRFEWIGALSHLQIAHRAQTLFALSIGSYLDSYALPAVADRATERSRCAACLVIVASLHLSDVLPVAVALAAVWGDSDPATDQLRAIIDKAAAGQLVTE
jgi:hypothetical protein